ncbi:MAG TPA: YhcH/YjgK/YiaL family protein [Paludibacteraceae bacterium]|mgnify:CR=1 FL=1|nr:YhcH/YjgK/YiaL family protein [Paludibacteraceae bacterium]HPH62113.1 YhcH/YjgK/YiaL family protein [Paludibacteraceae bacterium]
MNIKFLILDVDGTLTDSKVYMGEDGEFFKAFDIKDGCGIKEILPKYGITPIIITARKSQALENRCKELGISELHQGCRKKLEKLNEILKSKSEDYSLANVAYIGDDFLDIPPMQAAKEAGGLGACPNNAIDSVKEMADFICNKNAGDGAVREFIDWLVDFIEEKNISEIKKYSPDAYLFAKTFFNKHILDGSYPLNNGVIANVMTYITKPAVLTCFEGHKKYIDVQYILYGEEIMSVEDISNINTKCDAEYDENKDVTLYEFNGGKCCILKAGDVIVLKENDIHRGAIAVDIPKEIRKIVFKVPII